MAQPLDAMQAKYSKYLNYMAKRLFLPHDKCGKVQEWCLKDVMLTPD